jgi:recombination protein RecA
MPSEKVEKLLKKLNNDKNISNILDGNKLGTVKDYVPPRKNVISTGSLVFDYSVLNIGGIPKGCITELFGPEGAGKTTMAMLLVAEAQRNGIPCMYLDTECSVDLSYSEKLGVDIDDLIYRKPETAERALDLIYHASKLGGVGLIVLDTIASMIPTASLEASADDVQVALIARLLSANLPKIRTALNKNDVALLCVNQVREKIGGYSSYAATTTPGGRAMRHYTDLRVEISRSDLEKDGGNIIGQVIRMSLKKTRFGSPYKKGTAKLIYGEGFSVGDEIIEVAEMCGIIERKGAHYYYNGQRLGMGKLKSTKYMKEHGIFEEIKEAVETTLLPDNDETEEGIVIKNTEDEE